MRSSIVSDHARTVAEAWTKDYGDTFLSREELTGILTGVCCEMADWLNDQYVPIIAKITEACECASIDLLDNGNHTD